jgi:hypothetical protein
MNVQEKKARISGLPFSFKLVISHYNGGKSRRFAGELFVRKLDSTGLFRRIKNQVRTAEFNIRRG